MKYNFGYKLKGMVFTSLLVFSVLFFSVGFAHHADAPAHLKNKIAQSTAEKPIENTQYNAPQADAESAVQPERLEDLSNWEALPNNENWFMQLLGLGSAPQTTIAPANAIGHEINQLYALISWIGVGVFMLLLVLFLIIVILFRERKNPQAKDSHSPVWFELMWMALPIVILIVILIPTMRLTFQLGTPPVIEEQSTLKFFHQNELAVQDRYLEVTVVGHQWWWEFEYEGWHVKENGQPKFIPIHRVNANEPWLPVGVPIKLNLISEDVIHSFWLPRLAGKVDVVPGQINTLSFIIEQEGYYWGQCAEYCGASHALMRFHTIGINEADFNTWLNWGQGDVVVSSSSAKRGQEYVQTCLGCHTMNGLRPFEKRQVRFEKDTQVYEENLKTYQAIIQEWDAARAAELGTHFQRVVREQPDRPNLPKRPKLYQGAYQTLAPDFTDLRFRRKLFSGIQENTRENLKRWIENPAAVKPEIAGTKRVNMPAYHGIFDEQMILDTVEFLKTVEYTGSVSPEQLTLWREK